ncbi:MAG: NYN domain-containing protein [Flavobacteriales bacterium]
MVTTAILIDGSFFHKRYQRVYENAETHTPAEIADELFRMCLSHLNDKHEQRRLYCIFYYDCPPYDKELEKPISGEGVLYSETEQAHFKKEFFEELKRKRKIALRKGYLKERNGWLLKPSVSQEFIENQGGGHKLTDDDFFYDLQQKNVDMKIGIDIASMVFKNAVNQIILISGDADFVPAAKLARREGIDFILDPMWNSIHPDLFEHIDGLKSTCPNPFKEENNYNYQQEEVIEEYMNG